MDGLSFNRDHRVHHFDRNRSHRTFYANRLHWDRLRLYLHFRYDRKHHQLCRYRARRRHRLVSDYCCCRGLHSDYARDSIVRHQRPGGHVNYDPAQASDRHRCRDCPVSLLGIALAAVCVLGIVVCLVVLAMANGDE